MRRVGLALASAWLGIGAAWADDTQTLLRRHDCYVCHADAAAKTGPAFDDVATRYRGDPKAAERLASALTRGARGGGPWHMPPHPEISAAEAKQMARYILSLKKPPTPAN